MENGFDSEFEQQLPVKAIFFASIQQTRTQLPNLIRLAWPYALLILSASFIAIEADNFLGNLVISLGVGIIAAIGMVRCHRIFLLPTESLVTETVASIHARDFLFLLRVISISLLSILLFVPVGMLAVPITSLFSSNTGADIFLSQIALFLCALPAYYFISRWSLVLPDTALDKDRPLWWAWDISSKYSYQLFILIGFLPMVTNLLLSLLLSLLESSPILTFVESLVWLLVAVVELCILSLSYKWIIEKEVELDKLHQFVD